MLQTQEITDYDYQRFRRFLESACGILLGEGKQYLIVSRLTRLLRDENIAGLSELMTAIEKGQPRHLRDAVIDAMTTNETSWFRDGQPFETLEHVVLPELEKLRGDLSLLPSAVEESIRWVTPVKHFMRTATEDYTLRGKTIKAGDGICLHYPSGNRDEEIFEDPFTFKVDRKPNKQIAFGYGVHLCLGMHLARMEIKALYNELLSRVSYIELAGEPRNTHANFVSGLKTMPIRFKPA